MSSEKPCFFHRSCHSLRIGVGIGYCDVDNAWVICDGDRRYCENPDAPTHHRAVIGRPGPSVRDYSALSGRETVVLEKAA